MRDLSGSLMLWAFVVALFAAMGWGLGLWLMGKLTALVDRALA